MKSLIPKYYQMQDTGENTEAIITKISEENTNDKYNLKIGEYNPNGNSGNSREINLLMNYTDDRKVDTFNFFYGECEGIHINDYSRSISGYYDEERGEHIIEFFTAVNNNKGKYKDKVTGKLHCRGTLTDEICTKFFEIGLMDKGLENVEILNLVAEGKIEPRYLEAKGMAKAPIKVRNLLLDYGLIGNQKYDKGQELAI